LRKIAADLLAVNIEKQRVLECAPGKNAFGKSGQKHGIEDAPARFFNGANEHAAVTAPRRIAAEGAETVGEDAMNFP
jgi:hypothetical protein